MSREEQARRVVELLNRAHLAAGDLRSREVLAASTPGPVGGDPRTAAMVITHIEDAILRLEALGRAFS